MSTAPNRKPPLGPFACQAEVNKKVVGVLATVTSEPAKKYIDKLFEWMTKYVTMRFTNLLICFLFFCLWAICLGFLGWLWYDLATKHGKYICSHDTNRSWFLLLVPVTLSLVVGVINTFAQLLIFIDPCQNSPLNLLSKIAHGILELKASISASMGLLFLLLIYTLLQKLQWVCTTDKLYEDIKKYYARTCNFGVVALNIVEACMKGLGVIEKEPDVPGKFVVPWGSLFYLIMVSTLFGVFLGYKQHPKAFWDFFDEKIILIWSTQILFQATERCFQCSEALKEKEPSNQGLSSPDASTGSDLTGINDTINSSFDKLCNAIFPKNLEQQKDNFKSFMDTPQARIYFLSKIGFGFPDSFGQRQVWQYIIKVLTQRGTNLACHAYYVSPAQMSEIYKEFYKNISTSNGIPRLKTALDPGLTSIQIVKSDYVKKMKDIKNMLGGNIPGTSMRGRSIQYGGGGGGGGAPRTPAKRPSRLTFEQDVDNPPTSLVGGAPVKGSSTQVSKPGTSAMPGSEPTVNLNRQLIRQVGSRTCFDTWQAFGFVGLGILILSFGYLLLEVIKKYNQRLAGSLGDYPKYSYVPWVCVILSLSYSLIVRYVSQEWVNDVKEENESKP